MDSTLNRSCSFLWSATFRTPCICMRLAVRWAVQRKTRRGTQPLEQARVPQPTLICLCTTLIEPASVWTQSVCLCFLLPASLYFQPQWTQLKTCLPLTGPNVELWGQGKRNVGYFGEQDHSLSREGPNGAKSFLRSWQSLSLSIDSPPFMESEVSLLCS
jgi:hypothetical protein